MIHHAAPGFWAAYHALPRSIHEQADRAYERMKVDPAHPSLHLKKVGRFWSARVSRDYRALAVEAPDGLVWFWIGSHTDYDKLVR